MGASCSGCGACCQVIPLKQTEEELRALVAKDDAASPDAAFILTHWVELTPEQVAASPFPPLWEHPGYRHFSCTKYDPASRQCTVHETRPRICREFPWYDHGPQAYSIARFPECSYQADLSPEQQVELVQLRSAHG